VELYLHSPQYAFMAWCLVKHRDNFTLLYFTLIDICTAVNNLKSYRREVMFLTDT